MLAVLGSVLLSSLAILSPLAARSVTDAKANKRGAACRVSGLTRDAKPKTTKTRLVRLNFSDKNPNLELPLVVISPLSFSNPSAFALFSSTSH